jgi:hypothetical protein
MPSPTHTGWIHCNISYQHHTNQHMHELHQDDVIKRLVVVMAVMDA